MTLSEEFKSRNFSKKARQGRHGNADLCRRTGVICILLCFALGISNLFNANWVIAFSIVCLIYAPIILFLEVPLLLRICPTSPKFDTFIRKFETNFLRAGLYAAMSAVQWASIAARVTSLIAAAVVLLFAAIFYALAGLKGQAFQGSKTLGGQGVAQMII
ncbi:Golgi apparatus membrane protein tvp18 [Didymosphaeria variabile]|uniref:Golgi apparatus membrane protein tvp18 n=1 Tax=Didymosphaeria variabile TaxID=1932322 RepID=A0A9W9C8I6_9PLEO|nr:Golgi apparatus membrane protein tvp18 [Didymosphaeria variabile]KAJ4349806.1 Golgi apparatus membrane protein tvp18 [Didymosphaeria variabile]